ncbi:MAG: hypothetical protein ACYTGZ_01080 [Planctomycetota bacterium]|jgi:hypothetical protein
MTPKLWKIVVPVAIAGYLLTDPLHAHHGWELVPFFYSIYALLGCVALVFAAVWLGGLFVQQPEDFYRDD